eukprot:3806991-Pyramimonas_sp.AAC.1
MECIDENMAAYFEILISVLVDSQGWRRSLTAQMLDCFVANQQRKDNIEFHWNNLSSFGKA